MAQRRKGHIRHNMAQTKLKSDVPILGPGKLREGGHLEGVVGPLSRVQVTKVEHSSYILTAIRPAPLHGAGVRAGGMYGRRRLRVHIVVLHDHAPKKELQMLRLNHLRRSATS